MPPSRRVNRKVTSDKETNREWIFETDQGCSFGALRVTRFAFKLSLPPTSRVRSVLLAVFLHSWERISRTLVLGWIQIANGYCKDDRYHKFNFSVVLSGL